jgi:succinyl-diaminopimelate desuccinylase
VTDIGERLAGRTLALVGIPSVSGDEAAVLEALEVPADLPVVDADDTVRLFGPPVRRRGAPLVALAGHVYTVPVGESAPAGRDGDEIAGRGAADMKGGLAVMEAIAAAVAAPGFTTDVDVCFLFFGREELPITVSALLPLFDRCAEARAIDLAIVMEPTANAIEVGCLGNLNARAVIRGRAAHSARPWLGHNAIHEAVRSLAGIAVAEAVDVTVDGLTYREVVSVTAIEGGVACNVVPDRVEAHLNYRYAPGVDPAEAEARLGEMLPGAEIEVLGNAPPGPVVVRNPLLDRLRAAGSLEVRPKQAWTPVAEFGLAGIDAVNLGPGDPGYAHRDDERVSVAALVRSYEVLTAFLTGDGAAWKEA